MKQDDYKRIVAALRYCAKDCDCKYCPGQEGDGSCRVTLYAADAIDRLRLKVAELSKAEGKK